MNRKIKAALLAGVIAVGSVASAAADEIKFGASAPLTGPRALLGKYFKEGVDMAVEEINANGGVLGKTLSIAYEDDQADNPNAAITSMSKLMEVAKVPIVLGPHFSVAQLATMKSYCNGSLISITGASGVPVTNQGCNYVVRIRGNDNLQAKAVRACQRQSSSRHVLIAAEK